MGKLAKIIRMEFRLTVANRVFIILTIIGPFLIAAITILPSVFSSSTGAMGSPARIALLGADPRFVQEISPAFKQSDRGQRGTGIRRIARLPGSGRGI